MRVARFVLATVMIVTWVSHASGQIVNGDFEQVGFGWFTEVGPADTLCDYPGILRHVNLPNPPGAATGRQYAAAIGDNPTTAQPACNPSVILQKFDCSFGTPMGNYCSVSFDASCWDCDGSDRVLVVLETPVETRAWRIPCRERGASGRYTVSARGCSKVVIEFFIAPAGDAVRDIESTLWLDNVTSQCSSEDRTSEVMIPISPDSAYVVDADSSLSLRQLLHASGPVDCNQNGVPDSAEICANPSLDEDNDGQLDNCAASGRQINWILLVMGIVIIAATMVRLIWQARRVNRP